MNHYVKNGGLTREAHKESKISLAIGIKRITSVPYLTLALGIDNNISYFNFRCLYHKYNDE